MQADTLNTLIAEWARSDARKEAGYAAPVVVLAERLAAVHYHRVVRLALATWADAYLDRECASRTYAVGFRDSRDPATYNAACYALAVSARRLGFRATVRKPGAGSARCTLRVTLPADIEADAAKAHPLYLSALATERALLARRAA